MDIAIILIIIGAVLIIMAIIGYAAEKQGIGKKKEKSEEQISEVSLNQNTQNINNQISKPNYNTIYENNNHNFENNYSNQNKEVNIINNFCNNQNNIGNNNNINIEEKIPNNNILESKQNMNYINEKQNEIK